MFRSYRILIITKKKWLERKNIARGRKPKNRLTEKVKKKNFSEKTKKKIDQCFNKKVPQKEYVKNFLFRFQKWNEEYLNS